MIELYTAPTPNGHKASIMLEELGVPYTVKVVNLMKGDQLRPDYLKLNPNSRIPTIVDWDNGPEKSGFAVFESGAILIYLAEKYGRFLPKDVKGRSTVIQWVMFQMGGIGPMMGQANVFFRYWPNKIPEVIERYHKEVRRLFEVLEKRLQGRDYLCDEYSIADIASYPWVRTYRWSGVAVDDLPNLKAWRGRIRSRPAVERGLAVPGELTEDMALAGSKNIVVR